MRARHLIVPVMLIVVAQTSPGAAHAGARSASSRPVPKAVVRDGRVDEVLPAGAGSYFVWSQNSARHPRHFDLFFKDGGSPKRRVNDRDSAAFAGGVDGSTLIYQNVHRGRSNLKEYDLVTRSALPVPPRVNTDSWEWNPSISGTHLLFGRARGYADRVILLDTGGPSVTLASETGKHVHLWAGQVNGDWVTFHRCSQGSCDVYVYSISGGGSPSKIPSPGDRSQYDPSVADDGTVYFVRGGNKCGRNVRLMSYTSGGGLVEIASFPRGVDNIDTYTDSTGVDDLVYYNRFNCNTGAAGTFAEVVP